MKFLEICLKYLENQIELQLMKQILRIFFEFIL